MMYNQAQNAIASTNGSADTCQRPHERAVQNCHEILHKLDGVISEADSTLSPVTLPIPPSTDGSPKELRGCGPASSDVVNAVDGLAERINGLTVRLANLIGRVQV